MITSGIVAALTAVLVWGFVESFGHFYPAKPAWKRMRRARGRLAVRRMRERFETAADRGAGARRLALAVVIIMIGWVAVASLMEKRWYEVVVDVAPSLIVVLSLMRIPPALNAVAERMREYELSVGEDPDVPLEEERGDDGPTTMAL